MNPACETLTWPINAAGFKAIFHCYLVAGRAIGFSCEWEGDGPPRLSGQRRRTFLRAYEAERGRILHELEKRLGEQIWVVDL